VSEGGITSGSGLRAVKQSLLTLTDRSRLILLLIAFGFVLTLTIIPGVFIIDEDNYLVTVVGLRHGTLSVPGTEGLTPSRELVSFDPEASRRSVSSTPVYSLVPPAYAFLALPFSYAGWRGLVFLNILSFLAAIYLVFRYVELIAHQRASPWIASILFAVGGYCIEYAQGLWPEMLSVFLCTAAVFLSLQARKKDSLLHALIAGLFMGIATGVREQNIFFAGCVGLGLFVFSTRRFRISIAYAMGVAVLLAIIATLNFYRLGLWHPFPKVMAYTQEVSATAVASSLLEPLRVFWSKVVDYPSYGPTSDHIKSGLYQWEAASRTVLMNGIVKKSLIQSSPWIGLTLVAMIVAWFTRRSKASADRKEIQLLGLIVVPTLLMFSAAGFNRTDGLSFNQRYFLELIPLCAIALSLYLDRAALKTAPMAIGILSGITLVVLALILPSEVLSHIGQRYVPMLLAFIFILVWYIPNDQRMTALVLGICIGWAFFFHLETDLVGSRFRRAINETRYESLKKIVPDHSALFTYWGNKDAAGPLQLAKDVVILDVWADNGHDAKMLEEELRTRGRRIFILENNMPADILDGLMIDQTFRDFSNGNLELIEVLDGDRRVLRHE
jgi:hypothetical protein